MPKTASDQWPADQVERRPVSDLIPYARNSRTHSEAQVAQIAASIREFGWTMPVLVDEQGTIIAGHGRIMAAQKLGLADVPVMVARGWTDAQRRAYVIADNKLSLNAGWDEEALALELEELNAEGFDLSLTGFDSSELDALLAGEEAEADLGHHSGKIEAPIYEPSEEAPPSLRDLVDRGAETLLLAEIAQAPIPEDVRAFLELAASRHVRFNYRKIADYYAHATPEVQRLMEASALVIIDFEDAIAGGYVKLTKALAAARAAEFGEAAPDAP